MVGPMGWVCTDGSSPRPRIILSRGVLALEVGMGQAQAVQSELERVGYIPGGIRADEAGIGRIVTALRGAKQE